MSKFLFQEIQFSTDIAYGATGGPEFFTDIVTSSSGFEQRNINWHNARNRYNLAPGIKSLEQLEYLIKFFRLCRGKAIGFRFKDWIDYKIEKQQIAVADGDICEFQLIKTYVQGDFEYYRKITKPVKESIRIYLNDKPAKAKIDATNGLISFNEAPSEGSIIKAEGEFDVAVRFDIDQLVTSVENFGVYSHQDIPLIELKI